jgi:hypothetical protein
MYCVWSTVISPLLNVGNTQLGGVSSESENRMGNVWDVIEFRYWKATATNQNCVHEEIKRRLNSGNARCHSDQSLLSSLLAFVNILVEAEMFKTIILSIVVYGYETLSH